MVKVEFGQEEGKPTSITRDTRPDEQGKRKDDFQVEFQGGQKYSADWSHHKMTHVDAGGKSHDLFNTGEVDSSGKPVWKEGTMGENGEVTFNDEGREGEDGSRGPKKVRFDNGNITSIYENVTEITSDGKGDVKSVKRPGQENPTTVSRDDEGDVNKVENFNGQTYTRSGTSPDGKQEWTDGEGKTHTGEFKFNSDGSVMSFEPSAESATEPKVEINSDGTVETSVDGVTQSIEDARGQLYTRKPAEETKPPADEPPAGEGEPPAGEGEPPAGEGEPPAGEGEPPAGEGEPPAEGDPPPAADKPVKPNEGTWQTADGTEFTGELKRLPNGVVGVLQPDGSTKVQNTDGSTSTLDAQNRERERVFEDGSSYKKDESGRLTETFTGPGEGEDPGKVRQFSYEGDSKVPSAVREAPGGTPSEEIAKSAPTEVMHEGKLRVSNGQVPGSENFDPSSLGPEVSYNELGDRTQAGVGEEPPTITGVNGETLAEARKTSDLDPASGNQEVLERQAPADGAPESPLQEFYDKLAKFGEALGFTPEQGTRIKALTEGLNIPPDAIKALTEVMEANPEQLAAFGKGIIDALKEHGGVDAALEKLEANKDNESLKKVVSDLIDPAKIRTLPALFQAVVQQGKTPEEIGRRVASQFARFLE